MFAVNLFAAQTVVKYSDNSFHSSSMNTSVVVDSEGKAGEQMVY